MNVLFTNLAITGVCLFLLGYYFNYREKKIQQIAEKKLHEIKEKYLQQIAERKAREKKEIAKLKSIVQDLEDKHRQILRERLNKPKEVIIDKSQADEIIKKAQEKAKKIEEDVKEEADNFLEEQKKEVQTKMVDLVMGVAKKVLAKSLTYEDHRELIEKAFLEVEGEINDDK